MIRQKLPLIALLLSAGILLTTIPAAHADDVAYMQFRIGKSKEIHSVAIELLEADAPATVANFKKLARKKFYNGCSFHRVFPHMLVQTGDPESKHKDRAHAGTGGPGYTLPPEIRRKHIAGAVAMGRLPDKINPGRVSNGSQFFICLQPMPAYDGQYTVFGQVLYGMEDLDAASMVPVDSNDNPTNPVRIKRLQILPREKLPPAPVTVVAPAPGAAPVAKRPWWKIFR